MEIQSETLREVGAALDFGGGYVEITPLEEGRHGKIYTARKAGKRFLLKAASSGSAKDIEALKREYETMMPLAHPNVVYVFTYESESPVGPCIVMEYVDGRTLRQWLAERPPMRERSRIFAQLLDAVEYLHGKGLLHNDLSPENIMVTGTGNSLKIIDFGFSDDDMHCLGRQRGCTREYASPELIAGEPADARSDIYSIGVLMRDIFAGRFACVSRRACRKSPDARYGGVEALRKAWGRARRLPIYLVASILIAALAFMAGDMIVTKGRMREAQRIEKQRADSINAFKERVDRYYAEEIAAAKEQMASAPSYDRAMAVWNRLIDEYNSFWRALASECPEEYSAEILNYIVLKYNADFPPPPLCNPQE